MKIGIDFDNTIADYDALFRDAGKRAGLVDDSFVGGKKALRDYLRTRPLGELAWQRLQGEVYGALMKDAALFEGVADFLRHARDEGHEVCIVSHKSEYSHHDPQRVNLREAAKAWMESRGFFESDGYSLARGNVFFENTRGEKIARIAELQCTHFIDDLTEVLDDERFPRGLTRILFTNGASVPPDLSYTAHPNWGLIEKHVFGNVSSENAPQALTKEALATAESIIGAPIAEISPACGGRNSRVWRVRSGEKIFALKQYPSRQDDPRDRLGAEVDALRLLERCGLRSVSRVISVDRERNAALLSWIEGEPVGEVSAGDIDEATAFLAALHAIRTTSGFAAHRSDPEACLSLGEIERQIAVRLETLGALPAEEKALHDFLDTDVIEMFERVRATARARMGALGCKSDTFLPQKYRTLVPSDFGFHNSIRGRDGSLVFIDFEYFGWDDPVKLTADMLLHPGMRMAQECRQQFLTRAEEIYGEHDPRFHARLEALYPLFALRWALIVLNEFKPAVWRRRVASGATGRWEDAKTRQLALARKFVRNCLKSPSASLPAALKRSP